MKLSDIPEIVKHKKTIICLNNGRHLHTVPNNEQVFPVFSEVLEDWVLVNLKDIYQIEVLD